MAPTGPLLAIAVLAGAIGGAQVRLPPESAWLLVALFGVGVQSWRRNCHKVLTAATMAGFALSAALLAGQATDRALHPQLRGLLERAYGHFAIETLATGDPPEPLTTRLLLLEDAGLSAATPDSGVSLRAAVSAIRQDGEWRTGQHDVVRIAVNGAAAPSRVAEWRAGRTVVAPVVFRRPTSHFDEGVADSERELALRGTALLGSVKSGLLIDMASPGNRVDEATARIRAHVRQAVVRHVGRRDPLAGAIVTAVLIGDRTGLPDDIRTRLQAAGTYHVIAISGGNIAVIAGLVFGILSIVRVRGRAASVITIVVLLAYAEVVTAGPSVWRATVMAVLYLAARALDHRASVWQATSIAAIVLVLASPLAFLDPGFVLTFGATSALLEGGRRAHAALSRSVNRDARRSGRTRRFTLAVATWIATSLLASLAVEVALLPVSAASFSRVTFAGVLLNLLAVPLMAVVQVAGLIVVCVPHPDVVAGIAGRVAALAAEALVESARLVDLFPALAPRVPPPGASLIVAYYAGIAACVVGRVRVAGAAIAATAAFCIVCGYPIEGARTESAAARELRFTMLDVGQGESLLLEAPGAAPLLVDAGGALFGDAGSEIGERVVMPALWARGVRSLGALLITHGDPDHVGGAPPVIQTFIPRRLWTGIPVPTHQPVREVAALAVRAGAAPSELRRGADIPLGLARIRVLHPPPPDWERPRVRNDDSVVLEVRYGDVAILLTGDISAAVEHEIAPLLSEAPYRILKVAHHGSRTSSSAALLERWRPQVALISAGRGNRFGHPAADVLARLGSVGTKVYRTDRDGEVTVETDGKSVRVRTWMEGRK